MDLKPFWLSLNRSACYEQLMINQLRNEDNDEFYLKQDKKSKIDHVVDENYHIICEKSKFYKRKKKL